jgi:hypothetical protein
MAFTVKSIYKRIFEIFISSIAGVHGGWRLEINWQILDPLCMAAGKIAAIGLRTSMCFN